MPYIRDGKCVYKKSPSGGKGEKMGCSESEEKAKSYMKKLYMEESKSLAEFSMTITKASIPDAGKKNRTMRLSMVSSDTDEDAYEERMSAELFNDFVERINENKPVPAPFGSALNDGNWNGGMPYLSVSHYKSGDGKNVPGKIERVYVDGERLKSNAILDETPLGLAVWKSVCQDIEERSKRLEEKTFENPVRISIGFLDLEHKHVLDDGQEFIFTRTDLKQKCEKCEAGIGGKVYLKGQLVHKAFTRVPANPRTSVEVMKMADDVIKTKKDDAKSIIGDLADELVGKSTVEGDVLITKAKAEKDLENYAYGVRSAFYEKFLPPQPSMWIRSVTDKSVIVSEDDKLYRVGYTDKEGEFSFDERSKWEEVMIGLIPVKSEADKPEWEVELEKESTQESVIKSEVIMTEPVVVIEKEKMEDCEEGDEECKKMKAKTEEKSAFDLAVETFKSKVLAYRGKGSDSLKDLQPLFNQLGEAAKAEVFNPAEAVAEVNRAVVKEEIAAAIPEIVAQILKSLPNVQTVQATPVAKSEIPTPRSLFLNQNPVPQTKEMSMIERIAYNSTIGTVTGQKV